MSTTKTTTATDTESDVLAKIAEMSQSDRVIAERLHAVIKANAPGLTPRLWYGMPAYARNGKVVCHFQSAAKFKDAVRDVRLQRRDEPRRWRHVADLVREDRSGELSSRRRSHCVGWRFHAGR